MKPVFVVDLDGVLLDLDAIWLRWLFKEYGIVASASNMVHWNLKESFGNVETNRLWDHTWDTLAEPFHYAKSFISDLHMAGVQPIILTSRTKEAAQAAAQRDVAIHFPILKDQVYFSDHKDEWIKKQLLTPGHQVLGMVDDKWANVQVVSNVLANRTFLLDKPYNKCLDINVMYKRVYSLPEMFEIVVDSDQERLATYKKNFTRTFLTKELGVTVEGTYGWC